MKAIIEKQFYNNHILIEQSITSSDGLFSGNLGKVLYYINLYKAFSKSIYAEKALHIIQEVFENINSKKQLLFGVSLCNGTAGLAYVLNELVQLDMMEKDTIEQMDDLDKTLYKSAKHLMLAHHNDYLHGAMGIVYYFVQRLPNQKVAFYCTELLTIFCEKAIQTKQGAWFKNIVIKEDKEEETNFSLSHGQSSFLIILSQAYQKGIKLPIIPLIIEKGVHFILSYQKIPSAKKTFNSYFPSTVYQKKCSYTTRLAWCYGDLNIVLAILCCAEALHNKEWFLKANAIGEATISRNDLWKAAAKDSHICHGTSGLAQLYHTLYKKTSNMKYKNAWKHWLKLTATQLLPKEIEQQLYNEKEGELLEGLLGVNLFYLTYLSNKQLSWQKILLL